MPLLSADCRAQIAFIVDREHPERANRLAPCRIAVSRTAVAAIRWKSCCTARRAVCTWINSSKSTTPSCLPPSTPNRLLAVCATLEVDGMHTRCSLLLSRCSAASVSTPATQPALSTPALSTPVLSTLQFRSRSRRAMPSGAGEQCQAEAASNAKRRRRAMRGEQCH